MEKILVKVQDNIRDSIKDDFTMGNKSEVRKPEGYVEIYDVDSNGNKKLLGKHNLVVYLGREWIAQRLSTTDNASVSSDPTDYISWLGIGVGGTGVDPLIPTSPVDADLDLDTEVPIHATDPTCADFRLGAYYKHPFDQITFEQDPSNGNSYVIIKIQTTLGTDDANNSSPNNNISEAGLFVSQSNVSHNGSQYLFSRVTFPTIIKDATRQIMFIWYLYL
jgi:hypothetical protein